MTTLHPSKDPFHTSLPHLNSRGGAIPQTHLGAFGQRAFAGCVWSWCRLQYAGGKRILSTWGRCWHQKFGHGHTIFASFLHPHRLQYISNSKQLKVFTFWFHAIHGSTVSCLEFCDYIPLLYLVLLHAVVVLLLMFLFANRRNASKQKNSTWAEAYFMILHAWLLHQRLVLEGSKAGISITCSTITQAMADSRPFLFSLFDTMITYLPMLWWWLLQSSPPMSARCTGSGSGLGP